uniref:Plastid light harvesting protein n=1 Tax=Corethron hystrix TaxID=216773 RepID=A0A7S1FQV8_9STRA|mmetsp:Transcript_2151/g.4285  ORF Transcript_2151/g.4285 Transcript_2151/m.4285 type:complete len:235 (+) Transcript_2151:287-991(+)
MKLIIAALSAVGVSAFAPSSKVAKSTALNAVNWAPDESAFAYGLPGSLSPVNEFDPLGFAGEADLNTMKKYREAETMHGRVAMLAAIGMLVTEEPIEYHPLFEAYNKDIGPAIRHLDEVRATSPFFFEVLGLIIGSLELQRALVGFKAPGDNDKFQDLNDDYFPGDVGFDPLGLKPDNADEFFEMSTKELQHGRLAMLGVAGMVAQELVNGKEIFVNMGVAVDRFDPSLLPVQF